MAKTVLSNGQIQLSCVHQHNPSTTPMVGSSPSTGQVAEALNRKGM